MKWISKTNFSLFVIAIGLLTTGCKKDATAADAILTGPSAPATPGVVDATGGFNIKVNPPTTANYYIHLKDDFDKTCTVLSTATSDADKDIICTIETEELEAKFHGIDMVLNVPPSMCKFVEHRVSYYFGYQYGDAPATLLIRILDNGTVDPSSTPGGYLPDGTPVCAYDYSSSSGPNCCIGTTTITKTTGYLGSDPQTSIEIKDWGGQMGNCAAGAGAAYAKKSIVNGLPIPTIYKSVDGVSTTFTLAASLELANSYSVYYSNYFSGSTVPASFSNSGDIPDGNVARYYEWRCLNDADEISAKIRVEVREWNESSQFDLLASGNPDTTGTESYWGTDINDYFDWNDFLVGVPAYGIPADSYPGMPK